MEILFSSLIATAMPRSQLLAVFAARWKPFRFSSRVPGERSDVTALRDQKDTKAFKQQFLGKTHGAMQHFGPTFIAKHLPVPSAIPLHCCIQVPNYSLCKKWIQWQSGASEKDMKDYGLRLFLVHTLIKYRYRETSHEAQTVSLHTYPRNHLKRVFQSPTPEAPAQQVFCALSFPRKICFLFY